MDKERKEKWEIFQYGGGALHLLPASLKWEDLKCHYKTLYKSDIKTRVTWHPKCKCTFELKGYF